MFTVVVTSKSGKVQSTGATFPTKRHAMNEAARWQRLAFVASAEVKAEGH